MALWRRLRAAGAASVLNGAWVLPLTEKHKALFAQLTETVRGQGGSVTVLSTTPMAHAEEEAIIARFQADRAREYDEFAERSSGFIAEIEKETQRRKFTFAELEEVEDDLNKLSVWLAKIKARDFFPNARMQEADETLETCGAALQTFAGEVYAHEGIAGRAEDDTGSPGSKGEPSLGRREEPRDG